MKFSFKKPGAVGIMLLVLLGVAFSVASLQEQQTKTEQERKPEPLIASVKGPDLFRAYCASCHGDDGRGKVRSHQL